jgi:hypothetical protein
MGHLKRLAGFILVIFYINLISAYIDSGTGGLIPVKKIIKKIGKKVIKKSLSKRRNLLRRLFKKCTRHNNWF